ncbi:unnamed protein product [Ilex paraguariensis]|uniref:Ionotropic glutamate receptor C-terminal domain-containing protein n=1 Tax=Ilex paraguariensis TaxID=185542 RepID=A0ABC8RCA2_9AQUA
MDIYHPLFSSLISFAFFLISHQTTAGGGLETTDISSVRGTIGAIVDYGSRVGKEEKVAMEMAINDFNDHTNQRLILRVNNSQGDPFQAALTDLKTLEHRSTNLISEVAGSSDMALNHVENAPLDHGRETNRNSEFDAVVGDVAIISSRYKYAEFTQPHTESGLVMIVSVRSQSSNKALLFMKPFTRAMWFLIVFVNVYNGFVIWMIERPHYAEVRSSVMNQIGTPLWLAFGTLFSLNGEKLHSSLSRIAMVVWLFVAVIITQSYTANLTSMLTIQRLEPTVADIETLKHSNALVGYSRKSFVVNYLVDVLHFNTQNCKNISTTEEFALALRSGKIAAAFLEVPVAKLFLAKYCKSFITAGPTYKAFPKGSPMLPDINQALLKVSESGALHELERSMTRSEKCLDEESDKENVSLSANSFWVLFVFTGGTSTTALAIYIIRSKWKLENSIFQLGSIWMVIWIVLKHWESKRSRFSRRVSPVDTLADGPYALDSWTQV